MLYCAGISGILSAPTQAQSLLGVILDEDIPASQISGQLKEFEHLGISFLELKHPVSATLLDSLTNYNFEVLIRSKFNYLTSSVVEFNRQAILQEYMDIALYYAEYDFVQAYGLYSYSQSFLPGFKEEISSITEELSGTTNRNLYEVTTTGLSALDYAIVETTSINFQEGTPSVHLAKEFSMSDFSLLSSMVDQNPGLLFLNKDWLDEALASYSPFETTLLEYKETGNFVLPLPKDAPDTTPFNWPVLIFLLVWISVGVHVKLVPTYSALISRYFTSHRFFVDDIMRYRERSVISGIFLFFQHAFFSGLAIYIFGEASVSETGLEALYHYAPQLALFGKNYFSLFALGVALSVFVQIIGLAWLYFPSKSMTHFSQALSLYTWTFHVDFILVSILLLLQQTGGSETLITIFCALFIINWLTGFLLTSFDSSRYLTQGRATYIFYTFGLHSITNIALLVLIFSSDYAIDLLELVTTI